MNNLYIKNLNYQINYPVQNLFINHKIYSSDNSTIAIIFYSDIELKDIYVFEKDTVSLNINNRTLYEYFYIRSIYYDSINNKYTIYGEEK